MTVNSTPNNSPNNSPNNTAEDQEIDWAPAPEPVPAEGVPAVTDEELEKQALAHPGADGDPSTPE